MLLRDEVRRILWCLVAALALSHGSWGIVQLWPFEGAVTWINCERIKSGMSRDEVYNLLGGPGWKHDCGVGIPPASTPSSGTVQGSGFV